MADPKLGPLKKLLSTVSAWIAVVTCVLIPLIYFHTAYSYESDRMVLLANKTALKISEIVYVNPTLWYFLDHRLSGVLFDEARNYRHPIQQRIVDLDGNVIIENGADVPGLAIRTVAEIGDEFDPVGRVEISESILHIWLRTGLAAILGLGFGLAVYLTIRIIPLNAIAHAFRQRDRAENMLQESEDRFRGAFDNAGVGTVIRSADGESREHNRTFCDMLGYSAEELQFMRLREIAYPDDEPETTSIRYISFAETDNRTVERRFIRKDGRVIWCNVSYKTVFGASGKPLYTIAMYQDITDRREAEEHLRAAQKMEALGQLTGGVAHEFNNLLQVVTGNLDLLADDLADMEGPKEKVERVSKAAFWGKELTYRLLSYTGEQRTSPQVIDTGDFIENIVGLLRPMLGEAIEIDNKTAVHSWPISVDQGQLQAAILNIAINARDAMPDGGKIVIETANISLDNVVAAKRPYDVIPGDYVMISIADSGGGMSDEVRERVFDPFFTTKDVSKRTGLGLSMVFGFIRKQSGGFIDINSAVGRGTTIKLYLPRTTAVVNEEETPVPEESPRGDRAVVLVVEDHAGILGSTAEYLERGGYKVLQAESSVDALALSEQTEHIDVLLTDIVLRGAMSGIEVADTLRQRRPDIGVIFMSGHLEKTIEAKGNIDAPLLHKPFKLADLLTSVAAATLSR